MSQWDFGIPPNGRDDEYDKYDGYGAGAGVGEYRGAGEFSDDFEGGDFSPISYERDPFPPQDTLAWTSDPDPPRRVPVPPRREPWLDDDEWPPRHRRGARPDGRPGRSRWPRWVLPAAVATALVASAGVATVVLTGGQRSGQAAGTASSPVTRGSTTASGASAAPSATPRATATPTAASGQPLTLAQAQQVLASYTTVNNEANAQMSDTLLGTDETGSSYAIDAGIYQAQRAEKGTPYPAFAPLRTQYYIPRLPAAAGYPHWFAVQVVNADLASPTKAAGTEYLLFTQSAPGAPWLNAIEPYVLAGQAIPQVAIGTDGLATPVSPDATSLAVSPAQIPQLTSASLDGGQGGSGTPANPGNLADLLDEALWRQQLGTATVTDQHSPATGGQVFGLQTQDGGALLFYTDAAELTLTPATGQALHLSVPGFYSPSQAITTSAGLGYLEQFATYVPARGGSGLRVVADYSGITARN